MIEVVNLLNQSTAYKTNQRFAIAHHYKTTLQSTKIYNPVIGGGTGFLIRKPFTQLPSSLPNYSSFESSCLTLKLPSSMISVFNVYRPPSTSTFSKPFYVFLGEFCSFLSLAATTPHEFIITGDCNLHCVSKNVTLFTFAKAWLNIIQFQYSW